MLTTGSPQHRQGGNSDHLAVRDRPERAADIHSRRRVLQPDARNVRAGLDRSHSLASNAYHGRQLRGGDHMNALPRRGPLSICELPQGGAAWTSRDRGIFAHQGKCRHRHEVRHGDADQCRDRTRAH